jgi:ketosteroid isomerase-like protein
MEPCDVEQMVLRLYRAFERRDIDAIREMSDPEMVVYLRSETPEGAAMLRGPEGVSELWNTLDATFEGYRAEVLEITPGTDRAVVHCRQSGGIAGGDARAEGDIFHAWWFRDGRVIEMRHYSTHAEALAAAGIST